MALRLITAALVLAAAATATAEDNAGAERGFADVRLGYTFADLEYDGMFDGGTDEAFEADWDDQHRVWLQLMLSPEMDPHGWLFGIDLTSDSRDTNESDSDVDVEYQAWTAHLHVGYGMVFGNFFQLEFVPFAGAGISEAERRSLGEEDSDEDVVLEYGANLNGVLVLGRFLVGASIGYLLTDSEAEFRDAVDPNENVEYDWQSGSFTYAGFIGVRF